MTWSHFRALIERPSAGRGGRPERPIAPAFSAYTRWLLRHYRKVIAVCFALAAAGAVLAATLPLRTEFTWLLPDEQPSVVALRELTARKPSNAVIEIGVASPSPDATRRFTDDLARALRAKLPPSLLREVDEDDGEMRRFVWDHRHLYASVADLEQSRDELQERIQTEQAKANPFLLDLDDSPAPAKQGPSALDGLRKRLDEAKALAGRAPGYVGEQGRLRMLVVKCPFGDTEPQKGKAVLDGIAQAVASLHPSSYDAHLEVGYAGDPVSAALEHDLVLRDVATSSALCFLLVMVALLVAFRAKRAVMSLCVALAVGCALTFGFTRLWIGHLNSSTAFLGSVVAGNGINFGIIFLWRYLEERRRGQDHPRALEVSLARTSLPTLVAAAAAGTAYLSLTITSFRGFSEFGIIAGSGMVLCWAMSYLLLPALLTMFERREPVAMAPVARIDRPVGPPRLPRVGSFVARALPLAVVAVTTALGVYGAVRLSRDPFEDDLRALRSRSYPNSAPGQWSRRLDAAFGRDRSGGFYIGTERAADVPVVVQALRDVEKGVPADQRVFGKIDALPEALPGTPDEQRAKISLLGEVRRLALKVRAHLDDGSDDAKALDELLPPARDSLRVLGAGDLPRPVRDSFTEADGRVGLLLAVHPGPGFENWSYRGIRRATELLRALPLPDSVRRSIQVSGPEVIFVDMMEAVRHDGPRASLLSLGLVMLLLVIAFGLGRDAAVTAFATFAGLFGMLGLMAAFHVRLNFLNYIAVPITIGIGVDYPFNVMARLRQERSGALLTRGFLQTAGAVALCSLSTMIGYAVLLLSDTGAIRSFGMAAVLGEITSIFAAVITVPCIIALLARSRSPSRQPSLPSRDDDEGSVDELADLDVGLEPAMQRKAK